MKWDQRQHPGTEREINQAKSLLLLRSHINKKTN